MSERQRHGVETVGGIVGDDDECRNPPYNYGNPGARNDHDSLGQFQQRPSRGWGTPAQILNPAHPATSFYQHLLRVRGWQTLPLTRAAQAVQRSAFAGAYAKWEPVRLANSVQRRWSVALCRVCATWTRPEGAVLHLEGLCSL